MDAINRSPVEILCLPHVLWEQMRQDVDQRAPQEACGLLGGHFTSLAAQAESVWPVENALHSPVRYRLEPYQQLAVFDAIDTQGLDLIGIYHSHPHGPDQPSSTDIDEAYYPEVVHLIWSVRRDEWQCRGFTIRDRVVRPVRLEIDPK